MHEKFILKLSNVPTNEMEPRGALCFDAHLMDQICTHLYVVCVYVLVNCIPIWPITHVLLQPFDHLEWAGIAKSIRRLTAGWTVRGSKPGRGEIFRTRPDWP